MAKAKELQGALFDNPREWEDNWRGMPEFNQEDQKPWQSIKVHFASRDDRAAFSRLVEQKITDKTQSLWYPEAEIGRYGNKRYVSQAPANPKYPVYIISKGRWESRKTARCLEQIGVPYNIVIEPQELDEYAAVIDPAKILVLPFSNLGQGSIPARNWVWEHSIGRGAKRHWILDDNIEAFYRLNHNLKVPVSDGTTFAACESFADRYKNVAISGMNYFMFASRKSVMPAYVPNTRVYSCILIQNDTPHRWRGRYNEDTDLSLRVLKDGLCTVLFNAFLCGKQQTMTMKGGNTDELYAGDGRKVMAESLRDQHPDVASVVWKWDRWHHHVDYTPFAKNKLIPIDDLPEMSGTDDYGMELRRCCEDCKTILPYEFDGERCTPCETKQTK